MIPFLVKLQVESSTLQFFSDAAGSKKLGLACIFGNKWAQGLWRDTSLFHQGFTPNIAILELYAIVLAVELWASGLAGRTVVLRSDSQATVGWLERKNSDIPVVMHLLQQMTLTCLQFQVYIRAKFVSGTTNTAADLVSRNRLLEFHKRFPEAERNSTPLPRTLWPPKWTKEDMLLPKHLRKKKLQVKVNMSRS